jgi:hypothetical protein
VPEIGDQVRIESTKVGGAPRAGIVIAVIGQLLRIRWATGEESTVVPGPGAVAVIGKVRASRARKAPVPAKVVRATRSAKRSSR